MKGTYAYMYIRIISHNLDIFKGRGVLSYSGLLGIVCYFHHPHAYMLHLYMHVHVVHVQLMHVDFGDGAIGYPVTMVTTCTYA